MRQVHLIAGLFGTVAFLGTGLYMHFAQNHLYGMEVTPRLIYRSGHINFLFTRIDQYGPGTLPSPRPARLAKHCPVAGILPFAARSCALAHRLLR